MSRYRIRIEDAETGERLDYGGLPGEVESNYFLLIAKPPVSTETMRGMMVAYGASDSDQHDVGAEITAYFQHLAQVGNENGQFLQATISTGAGLEYTKLLANWMEEKSVRDCLLFLARTMA